MPALKIEPLSQELLFGRDYEYTHRAYEIMTDEEKKMCGERVRESCMKNLQKYLEPLPKSTKSGNDIKYATNI